MRDMVWAGWPDTEKESCPKGIVEELGVSTGRMKSGRPGLLKSCRFHGRKDLLIALGHDLTNHSSELLTIGGNYWNAF